VIVQGLIEPSKKLLARSLNGPGKFNDVGFAGIVKVRPGGGIKTLRVGCE